VVQAEQGEAVTLPSSTRATVITLGRNRFRVSSASGSRLAYAAVDGPRTWVFLDGEAYVLEDTAPDGPAGASRPDDGGALASPMPATVIDVRVSPGDRVRTGDVLVTVEAMKMELPILAPRDAIVASVRCKRGDLVQAGAPLVELN
jgi:biotin carboxyl carrier protein